MDQRLTCSNVRRFQEELILDELRAKWHILDRLLSLILGAMSVHVRWLTVIVSKRIMHCLSKQRKDGLTRRTNINWDALQLLYNLFEMLQLFR